MSGEQTGVVSNSYATYYSVRSSLRKTGKDLCIHLELYTDFLMDLLLEIKVPVNLNEEYQRQKVKHTTLHLYTM